MIIGLEERGIIWMACLLLYLFCGQQANKCKLINF